MSCSRLVIETDWLAPWLLGLFAGPSALRWRLRIRRRFRGAPRPGVLRVQRASFIGPAATVLSHRTRFVSDVESDVLLGASDVAWRTANEVEPWRMMHGPLPPLRLGSPDPQRSWGLIAPSAIPYQGAIRRFARQSNLQLHVVGTVGWRCRDAVWWAARGTSLASLLGKVSVVFADDCPLAWDAMRAGVPVLHPLPRPRALSDLSLRRLASTVPFPLVQDESFWCGLMDDLRRPEPIEPWGTRAWLERARAEGQRCSARMHLTKKLKKLRRDPIAFLTDSRYAFLRQWADDLHRHPTSIPLERSAVGGPSTRVVSLAAAAPSEDLECLQSAE